MIPSNAKYRFENMEALTKDPKFTFAGATEGVPLLAKRIASDLAKQ
jgi:hypothetical protein